jgi:ferredoxin
MRVQVDKQACRGYANCVMAAPDLFDLNDEGIVVILVDEIHGHQESDAREGVRSCPVHALRIAEDVG